MSTSLEGSTIGRFRVGRLLGQGGMGAVYFAFDAKLERDVALKVLHEEGESSLQRKRLLREARIAAKLQHPNIATIYEVEEDAGSLYIVMEMLEGQSLRKALHGRKFGTEEAIAIARDMARALARAHAADVVHRDIKPENVFLTTLSADTMIAKVLDFGLARQKPQPTAPAGAKNEEHTSTDTTSRGDMWGTPGYVSPEQALGQQVDARTDVFSFGVVFYEMLAGIRPFRGDTAVATMIATTRAEPQQLGELVPDLPREIDDIIKRCLMKRREDRYVDAGELSAALETFARGGAPGSVRRAAASDPSPRLVIHVNGEGDARTTGSAAISSMTMRDDTLFAVEEQRRERVKLAILVGGGLALAITSLVLVVSFAASRARTPGVVVAASASASASEAPPPVIDPVATVETPDATADPTPAATPLPMPMPTPTPTPHVAVAPHPTGAPAGSGKKKPADCVRPFNIDAKGVKIPKLYCL